VVQRSECRVRRFKVQGAACTLNRSQPTNEQSNRTARHPRAGAVLVQFWLAWAEFHDDSGGAVFWLGPMPSECPTCVCSVEESDVQSAHVMPVASVPSAFGPVRMSCSTGPGEHRRWRRSPGGSRHRRHALPEGTGGAARDLRQLRQAVSSRRRRDAVAYRERDTPPHAARAQRSDDLVRAVTISHGVGPA